MNSSKIVNIALLGLQIIALPSYALQTKTVRDNGTVYATISTQGMTRIAVDNDRISNLRGPAGVYTLENDNQQGAVYIRLMQNAGDMADANPVAGRAASTPKPFSVFISTEQNHNYVLKLTPRHQNADTILLKPVDAFNPEAAHWESTSPYTEAITSLMAAMVKGEPPEGYGVEDIRSAKKQFLGNVAYARLIRLYSGAHLQGQAYRLTNRTNVLLHVTESEFYQAGDRAIALSALNISPAGNVFLYKVRGNE